MTVLRADDWYLPALLPSRSDYQDRLNLILPQSISGITSSANLAAASIAFTAMYVGAIEHAHPIRPTTMLWMSDAIAECRQEEPRKGYYLASVSHRGERAVKEFCLDQGLDRGNTWYATNSREQARDESIKTLIAHGAMLKRSDVQTTSSRPRYTLERGFAGLLDPSLTGDALMEGIALWRSSHLSAVGRRRAAIQRDASRSINGVLVHLPGGDTRRLQPGASSEIIKGVVELFAPRCLSEPSVIFISQSAEKINLLDNQALTEMGLAIDQQNLLPDCIIADLGAEREAIWFIEIAASDGPITEERKEQLLASVASQMTEPTQCYFMTAFASRTHSTSKKALPLLARGSSAWFADEPQSLLSWDDMQSDDEPS